MQTGTHLPAPCSWLAAVIVCVSMLTLVKNNIYQNVLYVKYYLVIIFKQLHLGPKFPIEGKKMNFTIFQPEEKC